MVMLATMVWLGIKRNQVFSSKPPVVIKIKNNNNIYIYIYIYAVGLQYDAFVW